MKKNTRIFAMCLAAVLLSGVLTGCLAKNSPEQPAAEEPREQPAARQSSPAASQAPSTASTVAAPQQAPQDAQEQQSLRNETLGEGVFALTLLGIDSTPERREAGSGKRSDTIILLAIDSQNNTCKALTIPRDTRAKICRLNKKGKVVAQNYNRINAAYAYGGRDQYRHENALQALSNLLGVPLEYYASIDMDSIGPLAKALGGVQVTLDVSMEGVGQKGETVLLLEEEAEIYVRKRHGVTGGSDLARTKRQQQFVKACAQRIQQMGPVAAVPRLVAALGSRVRTNLSLGEMASLAQVLSGLDLDKVEFYTLPGRAKTIDGRSYFIHDREKTQALIKELFSQA